MKCLLAAFATALIALTAHAECRGQSEVAARFMNEYVQYCSNAASHRQTTGQWIQRNANVTQGFKHAYRQIVEDARKAEPEIGLDFDPVFDAQDYPDKGFKVLRCDDQSNLVTLSGREWENFLVVIKTVKTKDGWRVDGAGVINVPEGQRAPR